MNANPQFSVLIPSYNRPELIGAAVASVLANDFEDFEIVISDDKSPRQSEIAAALQPYLDDPRVRLHLQPVNLREAANREFLFSRARGEWQIILCDDDKLYPHALSTLVVAIQQHPEAGIYAFGYTIIDERDRVFYSRRAPKPLQVSDQDDRLVHALLISDAFPFWLYHPATFCSHKRVREMVKPNSNVGIGDDTMFLIDFINAGGVLQIVPRVLLYYRKMSPETANLQMNQSAGDLPNLVARAKILQHLLGQADLQPAIAVFVTGRTFRRRLLYDPIIWSGIPLEQLLPALHLQPDFEQELTAYRRRRPRLPCMIWFVLRRTTFFLSTFGFAGLQEIATVVFSRLTRRAN